MRTLTRWEGSEGFRQTVCWPHTALTDPLLLLRIPPSGSDILARQMNYGINLGQVCAGRWFLCGPHVPESSVVISWRRGTAQ